ncbi:tRNA pseudouridine(38-40) synthase TruA [Buchnera aphidicola]|uniref:tRNA pseudouridine(38-40) synthase TruA n=1 Tax=Buchnera aphidicola TaxID=9 RepID=UPI00346443F5
MKNLLKFALGLEYDGSNYHGWQRQKKNITTIQEEVEKAASIIADHNVNIICAGRTDAGVHSLGQVVHFETTSVRKNISWVLGMNTYLPSDISVKWIKKVSSDFHARYSAVSRSYRYIIYNNFSRSALFYHRSNHIHYTLNIKKMYQAGQLILGEHDFTSFRSKQCQSKTPYRKILYINVFKFKSFILIDITANSFLQNMVRNIVSCLIEIGMIKQKEEWILDILHKKDRTFCASTAVPQGLYLVSVDYPNFFNIPSSFLSQKNIF